MSEHSAAGSFAGYLYQIERVLYWVSKSDVRLVALETEDDVVAQFSGSSNPKKILEQAKHSLSDKIPYSNRSVDLWKSLSIWVSQVMDSEYDHSKDYYSLVSSKSMSSSRLIKRIVDSKSDPIIFETCVDELLDIANSPSTSIKEFTDTVLLCPRKDLESLLKKVEIHDQTETANTKQLKEFLRLNLSIGKNVPIEAVFRALIGFVTEQIMTKWRLGEDFVIERDSIVNETNRLIVLYHNKSFIEKTVESIPISDAAIESERQSLFVEQLRLIEGEDQEILNAINNFLRAEAEKSRFAVEGEILPSAFQNYYDDLKQKWFSVFKPKKRLGSGKDRLEDVGYDIYYSTISYKGKLNGQEPQQTYTHEGAYHFLANRLEIGWHPNWSELLAQIEALK
ncbi:MULTISPECIES: ABC-three component system protein [unclassified Imperialibacter]|uniref:ABC-three component system protein n=1 Tax=unclassified Imperialibacter TaxID=2629706 RepID=UPI001252F0ED|nr:MULTISPECIES: ABC-three component system protein [unclassified Imperialibacter]CAD5277567.1 conserved hypothetical protein [Imperialibacter sp. 75]CAD5295459.1 conserved hypothetical protein [Imperialibacter sp. 89]VVT12040.1 conserved hypothetical protein [Imperialibacter sp. EC-SDR9]